MFDLAVVICTHNPRVAYLRRTLSALQAQTLPSEKWELLLIDNASTQPLVSVWDLSWHRHARHIAESELGLSAARQRGMREAASDLLVFVDDDNVLDKDYLLNALAIKHDWPRLGVWGSGSIAPEYELQPQECVKKLLPYLAIRDTANPRWSNVPSSFDTIPWGAGLCARSVVADAYCKMNKESKILISGRRGGALLSGEDDEIAYVACKLGLGMGVFPELRLTHLIPKERVSPKYLLKLYEGTEISDVLLAYKWRGKYPRSPLHPRNLFDILKSLILLRGFDSQLYLAKVRALISARRIIAASRAPLIEAVV